MAGMVDFAAHNEDVREVWRRYHEGNPSRVPMIIGTSVRFTLLDRSINETGADFERFFNDPDVMFERHLFHQWWIRHHLPQDAEMGLPEAWTVSVDFQNSYEAMWFGAPIRYFADDVPDCPPIVTDENKWTFIDHGPPEPFSGWMGRAWEYWEYFREKARSYEYRGRPVHVGGVPGCGTDGPFTTACALRGATEICLDMYADPDFYHALMTLIVDATIGRMRAFRKRLGVPVDSTVWGFADDSIQLLSTRTYEELVLPYHERLTAEFGAEGPNSVHLCGDATRHFRVIRDRLKVNSFDTGFPVDFGALRADLGPDVQIYGGPPVALLLSGTPQAIRQEVRRILGTGVTEGGRFVLREANNLAPGTPMANVAAMYDACKEFERYE